MHSHLSEMSSITNDVQIKDLIVKPYPDGKRIYMVVELTPFRLNPSGDIVITDQDGRLVGGASFIEAVTPKFDLTLHLRLSKPGEHVATLTLFYTNEVEETDPEGTKFIRPEKMVVDTCITRFTIP